MTRLIDADVLRENMQWCIDHGMYDKPYDYLTEIDDAPTIDAVEVVRCKDCKRWHLDSHCDGYRSAGDFCSWGVRRKDGKA